MKKLLRIIFGVRAALTAAEASLIAQAEAKNRNWVWVAPIRLRESVRSFQFWTNADKKGGNVIIEVSVVDGKILKATFASR